MEGAVCWDKLGMEVVVSSMRGILEIDTIGGVGQLMEEAGCWDKLGIEVVVSIVGNKDERDKSKDAQ